MALIECVPNVSEGRRMEIVDAIAAAIGDTAGVRLLDHSSDSSHNRSVFTFVGDEHSLETAVMALYERALPTIDLRAHRGGHPRLGAVDVVPFVPLSGATMVDCVRLARRVAEAVATRHHLPVYLYEEAASDPARRPLELIRRGEFEGLAAKMATPGWAPDFGPSEPHQTAGASVIGARQPLIAYNVNLATSQLDIAKRVASAVRQSGGGLPFVKAIAVPLEDRGIVQVSMNLTDFETTPLHRAFEEVKHEAAKYGVAVLDSEIVGLVPAAAVAAAAAAYLQIDGFRPSQVLEHKLIE
jgi:glutamate formiminotransferase